MLLPGAREFFATRELMGALNELHFVRTVQAYIGQGIAVVLAAGVPLRGALGAVIAPDFATGDVVATELFWFVRAEERGAVGVRLLRALEETAKSRGAKRLVMMHLADAHAQRFESFYTRSGFRLREQAYAKEL